MARAGPPRSGAGSNPIAACCPLNRRSISRNSFARMCVPCWRFSRKSFQRNRQLGSHSHNAPGNFRTSETSKIPLTPAATSPPSAAASRQRICYSENDMPTSISRSRRPVALLIVIFLALPASFASFGFPQQTTAPAPPPSLTGKPGAADFSAAADEVLAQMSEITGLALRSPLKKSLRSREEIRAHLIQEMEADKYAADSNVGPQSPEGLRR